MKPRSASPSIVGAFIAFLLSGPVFAAPPARTDRYGDPLPSGAIARLGTIRLRPGTALRLLSVLPDQKTILSVASEEEHMVVRQWRLTTGELLCQFEAPISFLDGAALSRDGKLLATAGYDRSREKYRVRFWDVATGKALGALPDFDTRDLALALAPDDKLIATATLDKALILWDRTTGAEVRRIKEAKDNWSCLAFAPDGKLLASASSSQPKVHLWDVATGRELRVLDDKHKVRSTIAFSPDGKTLAAGSYDEKSIRLWEVATGKMVRELPGDWGTASLVFSPDGKILASGGNRVEEKILTRSPIRLLDPATGEELRRLPGHHFGTTALAFSADGKRLVSGGSGNVLHVWDTHSGKELVPFAEHQSYVISVAYSPDGRQIATGGLDGTIRLWEPGSGKPARLFEERHQQRVWRVIFAQKGRTLISHGHDGHIRFWDVATGRQTRDKQIEAAENNFPFACSSDGRTLAVWPLGKPIHLLDAATGETQRSLASIGGRYASLCFSPDGQKLAAQNEASGNGGGFLNVWDTANGKRLLERSITQLGPLVFSPDARTLFMGDSGFSTPLVMKERTFHAWDITTGKDRPFTVAQPSRIFPLTVSLDGRMLVWGDTEGIITLWDIAAGQIRRRLRGHRSFIESLSFAPDGKTLASGSADTTVLLWDVLGQADAERPAALAAEQLQALWNDLASKDAARAFDAIGRLATVPEQAVPLLKAHLRPAPASADGKQVARLVADLDSDQFTVREKAMTELRQLGERAEPGLREALKDKLSLEASKRIEEVLESIRVSTVSPERLRELRGVEVLEYVGTPAARELLESLAKGAATARLTREARAALQRRTAP